MSRFFLHWIIATFTIYIAAYIVPGVHTTIIAAFVFAVILAAINLFIRPIILLITLPLTIITLGLFSLVINALLILLAAYIVPGFFVSSFLQAFIFSIILSLINMLFGVRFLHK